jgi:signal transduction histidine kinase
MEPRRHTILIVDDEPDVLDSLRHLLHRHYRVVTAGSAAEGLRLLEHEDGQVHVILSDQRMPGMTGDEFLARARDMAPDAIRLLFTGYADIQAVINAINRGGIFRYILKPWDAAEMEAVIRQATDQFELLAERRRLLAELQSANGRLLEANRELAEADQLKTAFLEVASHELNTPITIVQGLSELLQLTNPDRSDSEREILRQITESSRQLSRLVANMLKLVDSGQFGSELHTEPIDLAGMVREAVARVEPFIQARRLELQSEIGEDLGDFEVDADKIRDVLLNLLTNAIKFTPDAGQIRLSARLVAPNEVEIQVADRGIGLEPRALQRLFSPFFTEFDPKHHSSGDFGFGKRGLGLGLYLVKTFIEQHGGSVRATSTPGQGTEVTLRLPRRPCPPPGDSVQYSGATAPAGPDRADGPA